MNRTFGSTGLFTFVGMMITLVGIFVCLFFLFTPVTFGATSSDVVVNRSADLQVSMRWIQPIVGQAIVEDALLKRKSRSESSGPIRPANWDPNVAERVSVDQAALIQWVMGRLIVELTRHRMESGLPLQDQVRDEVNHRILAITQQAGRQLDEIMRAEQRNRRTEDLPFIF